jgi:hypothetical protein
MRELQQQQMQNDCSNPAAMTTTTTTKQNKQSRTHARTQDNRHRDCRKELQQTKLQNWEWEKNKTRVQQNCRSRRQTLNQARGS